MPKAHLLHRAEQFEVYYFGKKLIGSCAISWDGDKINDPDRKHHTLYLDASTLSANAPYSFLFKIFPLTKSRLVHITNKASRELTKNGNGTKCKVIWQAK